LSKLSAADADRFRRDSPTILHVAGKRRPNRLRMTTADAEPLGGKSEVPIG